MCNELQCGTVRAGSAVFTGGSGWHSSALQSPDVEPEARHLRVINTSWAPTSPVQHAAAHLPCRIPHTAAVVRCGCDSGIVVRVGGVLEVFPPRKVKRSHVLAFRPV